MSRPVKEIKSTSTLIEILGKLRKRDQLCYFRGHSDCGYSYPLQPKIYRGKGLPACEDTLYREMILRCPSEFSTIPTTFEKLVKMQHYSVPTRLLDLTANPLVGLFFACQDSAAKPHTPVDGELKVLWIPRDEIRYFDSDTVSILANIAKLPGDFSVGGMKKSTIAAFNKRDEIKRLLHEVRQDRASFEDKIRPKTLGKVVCVKAKLDNPRIIRQDGLFFLFGIKGCKDACAEVPKEYDNIPWRLIVPHKFKRKIGEELDRLSICKASLFPEIDSVAKYLMTIYPPR